MNWQDRMKHEALCAVTGGYDHGCTCGRDAAVAAIEAVIEACRRHCGNFMLPDTGIKNALDRLDALGGEGGA